MKTTTILLLPLLVTLMSACGGGSTSDATGDEHPTQVPAPTPAPTPAPGPTPVPAPAVAKATAIGVAEGLPVSSSIGATGGRLETPDGSLAVIVPAGAFAAPTTVVLQPISNHAHGGIGRAWRITPHGLNTPVPMTLEWQYGADEAQAADGLAIATQRADGTWAALRAVQHDVAQRRLRVSTRHFSDWSLVAGLQLRPAQAVVEVGDSLALSITRCRTVNVSNDEQEIPLAECEVEAAAQFEDWDWSVNGVAFGNSTHGQVVKPTEFLYPGVATYQAPAAVPPSNPVAISVPYLSSEPFVVRNLITSNVRVVQATSGCNWLQDVQALSAEVEARYSWAGTNSLFQVEMDHSATVAGRLERVPSQLPILHWRGALTRGQVTVNERSVLGSGSQTVTETETGSGAPFLGDAPDEAPASAAVVTVDLHRCTVSVSTYFQVTTERFTNGLRAATTSQGGGGFAIGERDIGPWRIFAGSKAVAAVGTSTPDDAYYPAGLNNSLVVETAGSADVKWLFKPVQ